jgi:hypothetical protein
MLARVREVFGVTLTLRTLFANPTIEALAGEIERGLPAQPRVDATAPIEERAA